MGKESFTYSMLKVYYAKLIVYCTPYNVIWTLCVLLMMYLSKRSKKGFKNLKISLPQESHMLFGHAKFLDVNFLKVFGRICVDAADVYGLSSFFLFHQLCVCGEL
jgi:hypothetical protein